MHMANISQLLTEHIDIWTAAETEKKSGRGRASGNLGSVYGVKKLRELILELAVRGKLVPQDKNDEPASELLKRIQAEKAKLIAEGKFRKEKLLSPISEKEKPFELPKGWEWARLGDLIYIEMGQSPDSENYNQIGDGIPFFQGKSDFGALYPTERYWCNNPNKYSYPGDILLSIRAPVGPTNIANKKCCIGRGLAALRPIIDLDIFFLLALMRSFEKNLQAKATGTTFSAVSRNDIDSLLLPICSLNQQRLIVAKVDELMALCDQLEQHHSNAQKAHEKLVSQLLATLTQSQNAEEFNENWQRIHVHFDLLFTTEASIDALKQTMLQLAVMGKLVPQDPQDESASNLLKFIQAEKSKLIAEGKLKKEKPFVQISEDEKPFELPNGWEWTSLLNAAVINPRNAASDDLEASFVPMTLIGTAFTDKHQDEKRLWKEIKQGFTHFAEGDIGVAKITPCFENSKACVFENLENGLGAGTTELHIIRPVMNTLSPRYVLAYLKSPRFLELGKSKMTGTAGQKRLPRDFVETNPFPLPPLEEQHRIIAKVVTLMALCDQLKTRIQQSNQQQQAIADVLVAQAVV